MESTIIKKSSEPSEKLTITRQKTITLVVFLTLLTILIASCLKDSSSIHESDHELSRTDLPSPPPPLHPIIKNACTNTLYPSLCFTTLASIPASATTFHHILEISINQTAKSVARTRLDILSLHHTHKDLNSQEKNALNDCTEMLDQTLYELGQAIDDLHSFPASIGFYLHRSYGNLKTLLSAAMTNENTCVDGFSDLEEAEDSQNDQKGLKDYLQNILTPISRLISNALAVIKYMETINQEEETLNGHLISRMPKDGFPAWMTSSDRNLMQIRAHNTRPDIIVARDGSGHFRLIGEALRMAPNRSMNRFVIKVKAGIYNETVVISREKVNIMLVGDGMNSTVITGSKSFAGGFSTFTSATLTVVGDRFLARDLTILNTAGPEKHQAVAVRVNSNSAFYRCNFSSYQDTLYAHSLRQFYRECTIQGTIDFIFGNAAAIFQHCLILVRKPSPGQKNMITAQGRGDPNQNTGISLQNCTIMAAPDFTMAERRNVTTFLGRPWRNYSRTMVMKSYLDDLIHPHGWCEWDEYSTLDTIEYIEYLNVGPGSDTKKRVTWRGYSKNCSEDIAKQFTVGAFLHGADDWLVSTGFPLSQGT